MSVTMERNDAGALIRLDGSVTVTAATELRRLLVEGLACSSSLQMDLERVDEIDITTLQLLWAAGREAIRVGGSIKIDLPETFGLAAREAGFEHFPEAHGSGVIGG